MDKDYNKFEVIFLENVIEFFEKIGDKARLKIIYNIRKVQVTNDPKLFKKLTYNIWEFRTNYENIQYRLFAFWDKSITNKTLVISTHGIIKKSDKVSKSEFERAEEIREKYFKQTKN